MIIKVTKKHIKRGRPADGRQCPIALALKDATFPNPLVREKYIMIEGDYYERIFILSQSCKQFIKKFDAGGPVKPFSFKVERP